MSFRRAVAAWAVAALFGFACGPAAQVAPGGAPGSDSVNGSNPSEAAPGSSAPSRNAPPSTIDPALPEGEQPGPDDGGVPLDGGSAADAGRDGGQVGKPDAGAVTFPSSAGWTFYGPQHGGPRTVLGVTADQGGNVWVAGGEEGLFLLRPGASTYQRFTTADGLHPYGYLADGSPATTQPWLKVISVAGGPAGTVFVGYEGKPPGPGELGCEDNWDGPSPNPAIYKSGDADKVTLAGAGIQVVHYDIFSGPGVVEAERRGREKLCTIHRIVYDASNQAVWFGGNHGFALGDARYTGNHTCNGQLSCSGVMEHVHPAINGYDKNGKAVFLTDGYRGIAVDPLTHDAWVGGQLRSTRFRYGTNGGNYWKAQVETEGSAYAWNRLDIWPDKVGEDAMPRPADRVDDVVMGMAGAADGTVWVGSATQGLAQLAANGSVLTYWKAELVAPHVSSVAIDPKDQSVWAGARWGGGLTRIAQGSVKHYGLATFGNALGNSPVSDVQMSGTGAGRRVLVGFEATGGSTGAVAIYAGN